MSLEEIKNKYSEFITFLIRYNKKNKTVFESIKSSLDDENYILNVSEKLFESINNKKNQSYLIDRNIHLFYSNNKHTFKMFDDINFKSILKTADKYVSHMIWEYIQVLFLLVASYKNYKDDWIELLLNSIENSECPAATQDEVIDEIVDDITSSLGTIMNGSGENKGNPLEMLFKTSTKIAEKYQNNLQNTNIELDKLLSSVIKSFNRKTNNKIDETEITGMINNNPIIQKLMNMMKNTNENPEDIKTELGNIGSEVGLDIGSIMNMAQGIASGEGGEGGLGGLSGGMLGKVMSTLMGGGGKKEGVNELTEEQIKEMEDFLKNNSEQFEEFLRNEKKQ